MNKTNSKLITFLFIAASLLVGFTMYELIVALSGAFSIFAKLSSFDLFKHGFPFVVALGLFIYLQFNQKVLKWADEVIVEIKKVVWAPFKDVRAMTMIVIVMVFISSIIISAFDLFSAFAFNQLIK